MENYWGLLTGDVGVEMVGRKVEDSGTMDTYLDTYMDT